MLSNRIADDFDNVLVQSIDEAVRSLFSQQVVDSLRINLRTKRSLSEKDLPANLQVLSIVLRKYFGLGAQTIENTIAQRLYANCGVEFQRNEDYQLTDYVEDVRNKLVSEAGTRKSMTERTVSLPLKGDWDRLLVESVKEGIEEVLGKDPARLAFHFLESEVSFDKLPRHMPTFYAALRKNFGKDCTTIERAIAKKLYQKLSFEFDEIPGTDLSKYVETAYIKLSQREQQGFAHVSR